MSVSVFLACLYCFVGCIGYCLLVNIKGKVMLLACLGSALCWWVYVLCNGLGSDIFQCFIATVVVSIYSEILARKCKAPTTCFQIVSILPLVPGGGIYYTMEYCINGNIAAFIETGLHTFGVAGSIAIGILFVSSCVHLMGKIRMASKKTKA